MAADVLAYSDASDDDRDAARRPLGLRDHAGLTGGRGSAPMTRSHRFLDCVVRPPVVADDAGAPVPERSPAQPRPEPAVPVPAGAHRVA